MARDLSRLIPAAAWLRAYDKKWLRSDLVAGLTAAAVVVPQSMAYAGIADLPLVIGLYTAFVPLLVYAVMGTSRSLSVTTTSTIALLSAGALQQIRAGAPNEAVIPAAATLSVAVGGVLLIAWALRLGIVASLISEPVLVGFKAGVGFVIVVDQLPKLLGIHFVKGHLLHNILSIAGHLPEASLPTLILALGMLALLIGLKRLAPAAPAALVAVATGIALSASLDISRRGVELVGTVQGGFPSFAFPQVQLLEELWLAAVGIALMSFVETVAAGQAFRGPDEPRPVPNQELLAIGLTNLVGGLFQAMPSGGGTSQTAVNQRAGARTQLAGLATMGIVIAVLLFLAPLVRWMPQATLAAVVVVPCAGMIRLAEFRVILRARVMEFSWAIVAFAGVAILGTLRGIIVAVVLSLLALMYHGSRRPVLILARKPGTNVFRPQSAEHPRDEAFPGLLMVKTEGIMHFANAQRIGNVIWPLVEKLEPRVVVVDCSAVPDIEYTALKMLTEAQKKFLKMGVTLWLAGLNPEPLRLVQKSPLGETLGRERMFFTLVQAVETYQKQFPCKPVSAHETAAGGSGNDQERQ